MRRRVLVHGGAAVAVPIVAALLGACALPGPTGGAPATGSGAGAPTVPTVPTVPTSEPSAATGTAEPTSTTQTTAASSAAAQAELAAGWAALRPTLPARSAGIAVLPVGSATPMTLGDWSTGPAWSTSKVAVSIAALQAAGPSGHDATLRLATSAITASDNAAAEALWAQLGSGVAAATRVDAVLAGHGDSLTRTQAQRVRPPYTAFGQTQWSLAQQARFAAGLVCDTDTAAVHETVGLMGRVSAGQRWGLGRLDEAVFKGGWGPEPGGAYLVRQFGVVTIGGHRVAVAIAAMPRAGSFEQGTAVLDSIARWLATQRLPAGPGCT